MELNQKSLDYYRIAKAIEFINQNFKAQPNLDQIADAVNLSPFHFQKLFTNWAGVSPKKFLQFISVKYAKEVLRDKSANLFDAAYQTGLSGTGRLHDLFVNIEGMTPGEFQNGGINLKIAYQFYETFFGKIIIANTIKGICFMAFADELHLAFENLRTHFANADLVNEQNETQMLALAIFSKDWSDIKQIKLHLKGTPFQLKVWETLLKIPTGNLTSYREIAKKIETPNASRAVGKAIGANPIAFLIPCHRVIQTTGNFGGYRWGFTRKAAIIGWEAATKNLI
ncbi:cysteine methyltransferase [Pedobacter psychrophilus]|uniref:methylated-DNA--[protein]-cysteine S-methyltransferase n=1 Tax=Pedobacter psychrophilus TaxID=1826909 RepID=A0A179DE41_9SPHI|nr:methylated-DNA--[protein]-cysteine S-methyltransferase [Pedobacter psychrophilus]OAQ39306.1 cysteine methyltransferase [Pedobacter psychrophilus]